MVIPAASIPRQGLRTADGEVFAYVVHADELARMQAEIAALRAERDRYAARIEEMVRTWVPAPMTPEEIAEVERNPGDLSGLIAQLERE